MKQNSTIPPQTFFKPTFLTLAIAGLLIFLSADWAVARDDFFNQASDGDFADPANWQGGTLPGGFGNTFIGSSDLGSPTLVPVTAFLDSDVFSWQTGRLFLGQGGSGDATLNILNGGSLQYGELYIGRDAGAVGVLNQSGGTMQINAGMIEIQSGGVSGTYNLSGGTLTSINPNPTSISVGAWGSGTGYFNMSGGTLNAGTTHEHSLNVGWGARGEATFSGGTATLTGDLNAGNRGNGLVTISGTATVNTKSVNVGLNSEAANSQLAVSGGTLSVANSISVANSSALVVTGGEVTAAGLIIASDSAVTNSGGVLNIPAITNNGTLTFNRADTLSLTGTLSGSGTNRVLGGTTVSLDNGAAWSGGEIFILSNGLVRFNGGSGNGAASLNLDGGVVDVSGQSLPADSWANLISRISGAKLVNSSTSPAAIGSGNNTLWLYTASLEIETVGDLQIDSVIHSTLAPTATGIIKTGAGKLTLTAANTYTGGTTVSDGELVIAQADFTATITPSAISVTLSNTPSVGDNFQLVPGSLDGSYGSPSVTPLGAGQSASFNASTGLLSITQSASGPTFTDAYPDNAMNDLAPNGQTFLVNYALGGDSSTPATLPWQDTSDPTKLTLVAYVRTNNPVGTTLLVEGQKSDSLTNFDVADPVPGVAAGDQSDAPAGTEKRVFSVLREGNRLFLRLKISYLD